MSESSYYECCGSFGTHTFSCVQKAMQKLHAGGGSLSMKTPTSKEIERPPQVTHVCTAPCACGNPDADVWRIGRYTKVICQRCGTVADWREERKEYFVMSGPGWKAGEISTWELTRAELYTESAAKAYAANGAVAYHVSTMRREIEDAAKNVTRLKAALDGADQASSITEPKATLNTNATGLPVGDFNVSSADFLRANPDWQSNKPSETWRIEVTPDPAEISVDGWTTGKRRYYLNGREVDEATFNRSTGIRAKRHFRIDVDSVTGPRYYIDDVEVDRADYVSVRNREKD